MSHFVQAGFLNINEWPWSLIWALIWLTPSILCFSSIDLMINLSLIFDLLWKLSSLFWDFCNCAISRGDGSSSDHLTCPNNCKPYLSLKVKRLSATFLSPSSLSEFLNLQITNSLWLRDDKTPPFLVIWVFHFISSSKVIPKSLALFSCLMVSAWLSGI